MRLFLLALFGLFLCQNCQKNSSDSASDSQPKTVTDRHFRLRTADETGIKFANNLKETATDNVIVNPYLYNGGGVAVVDVNNDDLPDLFFTSTQQQCKLYINRGNFKFEDVTNRAGVAAPEGTKSGVAVADVNGDGWMDIYVCRTGRQPSDTRRNLLFINTGAVDGYPVFEEKGKEYGLDDASASNHANFFDYDLDGDLDMYLVNYPTDFHQVSQMHLQQDLNGKITRSNAPLRPFDSDRFYRNDGGKFTDVTEKAGIVNYAWGLSATVSDFNRDGWPDVYVANDYIEHDFLYINNRNGTFTDRSMSAFKHFAHNAMGADIADVNNDGHQDLVVLDMLAPTYTRQKTLGTAMVLERYTTLLNHGYGHQLSRNVLQISNGDGTFSDAGCLAGVFRTDWSWAPLLADFDNDGHRDLYLSNGYRRDVTDMDYMVYTSDSIVKTGKPESVLFANMDEYLKLIPSKSLQKFMFRNRGDGAFDDVSTVWGLTEEAYSNGAAYADLDRDGDLDLVVNNIDSQSFIYENTATGNNWLQAKCAGPKGNPTGIGAQIRITSGGQQQVAEMTNVRGFLSCSEAVAQFGLGKNSAVEKVEIRWPDGKIQALENVAANTRLTLKYADARPGKWLDNPQPAPVFAAANAGLNFRHTENQFEDLTRERLLTHRFSRSGPALAVADVNADGLDDVFFGGAAGQAGALFLQKNGAFAATQIADFQNDKRHEDVAATFFDADGDGDQDLYVVSGSNEEAAATSYYQDRLYLTDPQKVGQAVVCNFTRATDALPIETEAGSCVLSIDFDRDGKMDLVVGGSVVPGRFPEACKTLFLKNLGGKFQSTPSPLGRAGEGLLVNDLKAADLDGDGQPEIVAAGEWMPISIWKFDNGKWRDATADFGLATTNGWWNCLEISDLNGDGRPDIVAGNLGLNTRHRASADSPMRLFAKDIDGNGSLDPIVAVEEDGRWVPLVTRDLLLKQVPPLKKKYLRFVPYAQASVEDVVSGVNPLEIKMLETVWLENLGGKFAVRPLPLAAQIAPVKGILPGDFNADGKPDLLLVGNDSHLDIETGPADASTGIFLAGDGRGGWSVVSNSGFKAAKEARKIALVRLPGGRKMVVVANNDDAAEAAILK
ncbi:MAG: VCBS repeat-containing protein [Saprospiraceae bacterium]